MYHTDRPIPIHPFIEHQIGLISGLTPEQTDDYLAFVSILINERKATTLMEQSLILSFVSASFEEMRVQSHRAGFTSNILLAAAKNVFRLLDESLSADEIAEMARRYKTDPTFQNETQDRLERAGLSRDAIELDAELLSIELALSSARLCDHAVRRRLAVLKTLGLLRKHSSQGGRGA